MSPTGPVAPGATLTYTIGYENTGNATANSVTITDLVPANTTFVSADNGGLNSAGTVNWSIASINAGATGSVTLVVTVNANTPLGTTISNSATIAGPGVPPVPPTPPVDTPVAQPRLAITKSVSPTGPVAPGATLTYTIGYENIGNATANSVTITDLVPANTTFVSADNGGVNAAGTVTWSIASVNAGATGSVTLVVTVNANTPLGTTISNSATIGGPGVPPVPPTPPVDTPVAQPRLAITKSVSPTGPVAPGATLTYTIGYENTGNATANSVTITDLVPANTTFVSADNGGVNAAGTVTWSIASVNAGATGSVTLVVTVNENTPLGTTISNSATIAGPGVPPVPPTPPVDTPVAQPRLAITKSVSPTGPVAPGATLTYTIGYENTGNATANSVTITDLVPANTTFVSADNGGLNSAGTVNWSIASINAGATGSVTLVVTVNANTPLGTTISNSATIAGPGVPPVPPTPPVDTPVAQPRLAITKSVSPTGPVAPGATLTYTIGYENTGNATANSVTITDLVPANTTFVSADNGGVNNAGTVTWSIPSVNAGATGSVTLVVTVNENTPLGTTISNSATIAGPGVPPVPPTPPVDTPVAQARLAITKSVDKATALPGETLVYTIGYENVGNADATGVTIADVVPALTSFASASNGGINTAGTVNWTVGTVAAGNSGSVTLTVTLDSTFPIGTTPVTNSAVIAAPNAPPVPPTPPVTTTVTAAPVLVVSKSVNAATAAPGGSLVYTINYSNTGNADATAVTLTDTLPNLTSFTSATGGGNHAAGVVTWNIGTLAPGASSSVSVTVTLAAAFPVGTTTLSNVAVYATPDVPACVSGCSTTPALTTVKTAVVTAGGGTKTMGAVDPALSETTQVGFDAGDVAGITLSSTRAAGETVGSYATTATATGGNAGAYTITYVPGVFTITKATITVTANPKTIVYGSPDPVFDFTYGPFPGSGGPGDIDVPPTCTVSGAHANVGSYVINCAGASDVDYDFVYVPGTLTVDPRPAQVIANSTSKVFGATVTFAGTEFTTTGFVGTDNVTSATLTSAGAPPSASASGSPYSIIPSAGVGTGLSNYTITYVNGVLEVTKAIVTVEIPDVTVPYDGTPKGSVCTVSGGLPFTVSYVGTGATTYGPSPTAPTNAGTYAVSCTFAGDDDHDGPVTDNAIVTITKIPAQVIANSTSKVFGATVTFAGTEFTTTGFLGTDNVTSATLTSAGAPPSASAAGSPYSIIPSAGVGTGLSNYTITYVNGVLTVSKKTITVNVPDITVPFNGTPQGTTCSVSDGLTGNLIYTGVTPTVYGPSATAPTNAGVYTATCTFAGDDDHAGPVSDSGTVTITKIPATVTAGSGSKIFGAAETPLSAVTTTGFLPADVTAIVLAQSRAGGEAVGSYLTTATATGAVLDNYTVVYTNGNFDITPAPVVVTATPKTITYGDPEPTFDFTYGPFPGTENAGTVTTAPTCSVSGAHSAAGTYSIVCTGAEDQNLTFSYVPAPLVINPRPVTITAGGGTKVYGTTDPALTATTQSGLLPADVAGITLTSTRAAGQNVGNYATTPTATGGNIGNYVITPVNGVFSITPATLTVKADDKSRLQGEANPALTSTITGFVNGDTASVVSGTAALATTAVVASPSGAYPIVVTAGSLAAANYQFAFVNGTLTVLPNVTCSTNGYLTYSQGGWGNGGAPGQFLAAKFSMVYPTGYVIIGGVKTLKFTSANAIQAFLPQGGTPKALTSSAVNPTSSSAGNFAAQLLALRLAVDFSAAGATKTGMGDLVMVSGPLAGQTVNQILAMANTVIGGQTSALPSGMSISTLSGILESLNMNFHEGTVNNGLLGCGDAPSQCVAGTITLNGNSATSGTAGNIRSYSANGVNVKVSAFARAKSNGAWSSAFLGAWSPGVGVTDGSEGDGSGDTHMVDNIGDRNNYVLFAFDKPVVVTKAYLDYVGADSDAVIYVGTRPNAYTSPVTLSDTVLASLTAEENAAGSGDTRWATFNGGQLSGNVLVIAATPSGNNDSFKIGKLQFSSCVETPTCSAGTFATTGSSATSGTAGNVRSFTANGVSVKASAFSRAKTSGVWSTAFLGAWSVGMGVTDGSEGDGSGDTHKVDNVGDRNNYVLFEFSQPVVVTKAYLSYIGADGDATVWIGTKNDPYNNHLTLSDALLASLGKEDSLSSTTSAHWQPFNGGEVSGNVLVIAAQTTGSNDAFKIAKLEFTTCEGNEPPVNEPPVVSGPNRTNLEGDAVSVQVTGSDPDNDTITYSASGLPPGLSIDEETGAVTGNLSYTSSGTYNVTITVTDDGELTGTGTFVWTVTNKNRPPTVSSPNRTDNKGTSANVQVTGSDPDGDTLTYSATGLPPGTSMNTAGKITGTLTTAGTYTVTVTVKDTLNATGTGTFVWTVKQPNRAPDAVNDSTSTKKNTAKTITVLGNDTDPDGDTLTVTSVGTAACGSNNLTVVKNSNGTLTITPKNSWKGTTTFTYTISDGNGGTDTATVTVKVS